MNGANKAEPLIFKHLREERPNPKQILFYQAQAKHVCYGGARGGGKSYAMRRKLVMLCMRYDGLKCLLLRRTMPELRNNHILPLMSELAGYAAYNANERAFVFPNGSRLVLGYCDNDRDQMQYQGNEFDVIGFEEATNFQPEWITFISTSLRSTRTDFKTRIYYTANPGGVGHSYIKRLFIDRQFKPGENPDDYVFIPATIKDNDILMDADPDYIKMLEALPEQKRKAHLYGDWNVYEGQAFSEFRDDPDHYLDHLWTHVIEPFEIPPSWRVYRGFDFGYSKPFATLYIACDNDNRLYVFSEFYGCTGDPDVGVQWPTDQIFEEMRRIETTDRTLRNRDHIQGIADPAIWAKNGGPSVEETAARHGIYFDKGDNDRINGWQQLHNRLQFGEDGMPMLYIFRNCRNLIRTLPMMQYDETHVEDIDTKLEDHLMDSLRYVLMSRPYTPKPRKIAPVNPFDPLNQRTGNQTSNESRIASWAFK